MSKIFSAFFNLDNPGTKIKKFVRTVYIIEVVLSVAVALFVVFAATFSLFTQRMEFSEGLITLALTLILGLCSVVIVFFVTSISLWFPTILLYGFGEIIERLDNSENDENEDEYENEEDSSENDSFYDQNSVVMPSGCGKNTDEE